MRRRILSALALGGIAFLCGLPPLPASAQQIDLASMRIVDLTHAFDKDTVYWPNSPSGFELKTLHDGHTHHGHYYSAYLFCAPEHGGTHLDAPSHFAEGGWSASDIPVERFIGEGRVIDISKQAESNPDYTLTVEDVTDFEAEHGKIPAGVIVLLRTDWGPKYPDRLAYLGDDTPNDASNLHFPSFGPEAVEFLIRERRVGMIGVDTASIDPGNSPDFPVHRLAAALNVPGLENLANLDQLPPVGATLIALPMKIEGGSGGPVRAVALLPK